MIEIGPTDKVVIMGRSGSGKTTLCRGLQRQHERVVIFDRMREYSDEKGKRGVFFCENWAQFGTAIKACAKLKKFRLIFQFDVRETRHSSIFNEACWILYELSGMVGGLCIVVEEVWNFASPHFLSEALKEIQFTGRHKKIALITTAQRPAAVHKDIISQAGHRLIGIVDEPNDLAYLKGFIGDKINQVSKLKPFNFLHYTPGVENPEIVRNK